MSLRTNAELIDDGLMMGGESTAGNSQYDGAQAVAWYNWGYRTVWGGGDEFLASSNPEWWWLREYGQLLMEPAVNTGTVTVQNGSVTAFLSDTPAWQPVGRHLKVTDHPDVFIVESVGGPITELILDMPYTGPSTTTTYRLMKLDYDLAPNTIRVFAPMYPYVQRRWKRQFIEGIDLDVMRRRYPVESTESGTPRYFAPLSETRIRFSQYGGTTPEDTRRIDYRYMYEPADLADDGGSPLVPLRYRKVLAYLLAYRIREEKGQPVDRLEKQITAVLKAMEIEHYDHLADPDQAFGKIIPRQHDLDQFVGPLRTESGHIVG